MSVLLGSFPKELVFTTFDKIQGRDIFFTSILGSRMFQTQNEFSDVDTYAFVIPTWDDLYHSIVFTKDINQESLIEGIKVYDIRRLYELLFKSNIIHLSVLFSNKIKVNIKFKDEFQQLYDMREEIAKMNLRILFDTSFKITNHRKNKNKFKGREIILRHTGIIISFSKENITFNDAIDSLDVTYLRRIKEGVISEDEAEKDIKNALLNMEEIRELYLTLPNTETSDTLKFILNNLVRKNIIKNLK